MTPARYALDENGCWVWQRAIDARGYGAVRHDGRVVKAHRLIFEQFRGPIPEGLQLDHLCRNRACVNPEHLEPVTNLENTRRGSKTKLTADDVRAIRASGEPAAVLAERFGITKQYVGQLRNHRHCWTEIQEAA